jgi:hypothetical protein
VLPDFAGTYSASRRLLAVLPGLARLGVAQLAPTAAFSDLPSPAADQIRAFATSPRGMRNVRDEHSVLGDAFTQAEALTTLGGTPLVVVTATENLQTTRGWSAAQDRLAALSSNSSHRVADATHVGLLDDQHASEVSVRAIDDVVQSVRSGSLLPR